MPTHLIVSDIMVRSLPARSGSTPRLRDAVTHAATKDAELVLATGRPPRWIYPVLDQLPIRPICICVNGAVLYDSDTDRVVTARTLPPATLTRIMQLIDDVLPVSYAVERVGASAFDKCDELFLVTPDFLAPVGFGGAHGGGQDRAGGQNPPSSFWCVTIVRPHGTCIT